MKVPGFPLNFAPFNEVAPFSILYGVWFPCFLLPLLLHKGLVG
jgi:hypothetical protein